jgi:SAM-dependent methyltransferase
MDTQSSYDRVAAEYAEHYHNELERKPFDRVMLDWLAARAAPLGPICDVGCGPGHIADYLRRRGAQVQGIDLSAEMVAQARRLNPGLAFEQGDMRALTGVPDQAFGGVAAFYSIIHVAPDQVGVALRELHRVLRPGGTLLLTFHIGDEIRHLAEWWGKPVSLVFQFYERPAMRRHLQAAGFTVTEAIERDPYPDVEVETRRAYLFAERAVKTGGAE